MADSTVLTLLFAKARALGQPILAAAVITATVTWAARGLVDSNSSAIHDVGTHVANLDSTTVKRAEFDALVVELRRYAANADSTNALLRRYICREHPRICP